MGAKLRHNRVMDLDSWTPEDNARRYAIMVASCLGAFVGIAMWLAAQIHFLLALAAGFAVGLLLFFPLRWILVRVYDR